MRRIVAEKKQREERDRVVSDVGKATPLDVPVDSGKSKRRDSAGAVLLSQSEDVTSRGKSASGSPVRSRLSRSDSLGNVAEFIQPPSAKSVPTVVETFLDAAPSTRPRQLSDASGSMKTTPSSSQPSYSPMTMTIPGIHAKNKDSVMAIGFSPAPQPPSTLAKEDSVGSKIGNIYRLLNRNNQSTSSNDDAVGTLSSLLARQQEAEQAAVAEGGSENPVSKPPTPTPEAAQTTTARSSMEATPSSPASAALMSLVARDDHARRKSLTRRRTGSVSEYPTRQRSDSTSSSPLSASFSIPVSEPPVESEAVR